MARLTTSAPAVRAERPEVSQALDDVIHRCLARQPSARFGSAAAVRDALDRARLDPTGAIPRPVIGPRSVAATGATGVVDATPMAGSRRADGSHPPAARPGAARAHPSPQAPAAHVAVGAARGPRSRSAAASPRSSWSTTARARASGSNTGAASEPPATTATITAATAFDPPPGDGTEGRRVHQLRHRRRHHHRLDHRAVQPLPRRREEGRGPRALARPRVRRDEGDRRHAAGRLGRVDLRERQAGRRSLTTLADWGTGAGAAAPTSTERHTRSSSTA